VFDVAGNNITQSQSFGSHQLTIDLSNLAGGLYFIKAKTSGSEHTQKLTLKHE
jgi:hypothetical protein